MHLNDDDSRLLMDKIQEIIAVANQAASDGVGPAHTIYALARDARDILLMDHASRQMLNKLTNRMVVNGIDVESSVTELVKADQKILAIKEARKLYNLSLLDAKNLVEAIHLRLTNGF